MEGCAEMDRATVESPNGSLGAGGGKGRELARYSDVA